MTPIAQIIEVKQDIVESATTKEKKEEAKKEEENKEERLTIGQEKKKHDAVQNLVTLPRISPSINLAKPRLSTLALLLKMHFLSTGS